MDIGNPDLLPRALPERTLPDAPQQNALSRAEDPQPEREVDLG
jgi:hypothetical protein